MDGLDWIGLSYTAVTPRASLTSDANNERKYTQINYLPDNLMYIPKHDASTFENI